MFEVRIHGALGQEAFLCGRILASAVFYEGKFSSCFTFSGLDANDGAEIAHLRIDDMTIRRSHKITRPDCIVVLDQMLLDMPSTLEGLESNGKVIVNSKKTRYEMETGAKNVYTVDAEEASRLFLPKKSEGLSMAGAVAKVAGLAPEESIFRAADDIFPASAAPACKKAMQWCFNSVK